MTAADARVPDPIPPGAVIGIVGGGQLGRMIALAAARLGFDVHVYAAEPDTPAARVAAAATVGAYDDVATLSAFAAPCAVITYEFEHLPVDALRALEAATPVRPTPQALAIAQDRLAEKQFAAQCGAATAAFAPLDRDADAEPALAHVGAPAIVKTRRFGYDGKGQARVASPQELRAAWAVFGHEPAIVEGVVAFRREVSVIAARGVDGAFAAYDLTENHHEQGVLRESRAPAPHSDSLREEALSLTHRMMETLDYIGVMAVEFFDAPDGLRVNEIAPRVHNSGHWTEGGAWCDQFEQHTRAIAGWPLGNPSRRGGEVVMTNLLGDAIEAAPDLVREAGLRLTHYGKRAAKPGRKTGHVTRVTSTP